MEVWKPIEGHDGYEVSSLGRVRSFKQRTTPRILKPRTFRDGAYLIVGLYIGNDKSVFPFIHRLVAQAFIPNPENKPCVNHINGIKTDNRAENLEWVTYSENNHHAVKTGLILQGAERFNAKLTAAQVIFIRNNPDNLTLGELVSMFSVCKATITKIQRGLTYKNVDGKIRDKIDPNEHNRIPDDIRKQIRAEYKTGVRGCGSTTLAKKYCLTPQTIHNIVHEV